MKHPSDFAICISNYLTKHLADARNLSPNTIKSYRDTFCLLLLFMKEMNKKIDRICLADIDADLVIRFLDWLEVNRGNSASTRRSSGMCSSKIQKCCCTASAFLQFR